MGVLSIPYSRVDWLASLLRMSVVKLDGITYQAPLVHVVFIGTKSESSMLQTVVAPPLELDASSDLSLQDIFTLFRSTALTLAPKTKLTDVEARVVVTSLGETAAPPMKPLFLIAHVKVEKLALQRARSAYRLYEALKTEASVEGVALSDTAFAAVCGMKCAAFSKAMARVTSVPTPADGVTVTKLEKRIASYRADPASLKRDLEEFDAARKVRTCHAHSLCLCTHSSPSMATAVVMRAPRALLDC